MPDAHHPILNFGNPFPSGPILTIPKDSKLLFEPEINVKIEQPSPAPSGALVQNLNHSHNNSSDNFDKFIKKAKKLDPMLLWGVLRPKILHNVSTWDFLIDKTLVQAQSMPVGNVPSERLKIMLNEISELLNLVAQTLEHCCESYVKVEEPQETIGGIDDVIVPEKLLPYFGLAKNPLRLKANVDFSKYDRLFNIDESLKPEHYEGDIKGEDLKNLDNALELDLLEFALDHEEEDLEDEDEDELAEWKPSITNNPNKLPILVPIKKIEKPRQCDKCKKVFPRRQNYHFHRTKGRCPGVPQPPKFHKLQDSKYYCVHPDCGSGDGDIRESTPGFTSRGIYWKHLTEKHLTDNDKVFQCEVCPEKFAYQEMLKFHLQQKHEKQYTCKYCGKNVSTRASLTKHERCHTGEKPYACDQCIYRTASLSSLARHKRCKHDEGQAGRKHVCELCGKGFFTPNSLKEHMFTHSDIKRFSCHICGKQLKNDSCYRRHMVCVHGQKFTCELCNKDFSALNGINLHKREVHGIMY